MGFYVDFRKYPKTGWQKAMKKRQKEADERNKEAEESWNNNPDIVKVKELHEQQKLNNLAKFGLSPPDPQTNVSFSKNIEEAEEEIGKKLGNKDWNKVEDKKVEEKVENADSPFQFVGEILKVGDRVELSESESDFELSEEDKKGMENLLKILKTGKKLEMIPLSVKTINLSVN